MYAIHGSFAIQTLYPDFRSGKLRSEYEDIDIVVEEYFENALVALAKTSDIDWLDFDWVDIDRWPYDAPDFQITMIKFPDGSKIDFHELKWVTELSQNKDWFFHKSILDIAKWKIKAIKEWSTKSEIYEQDILWMIKKWILDIIAS